MKVIAETAWHHDGDFAFFKELVSTLVTSTPADYIKFHISLDADEYMHNDHAAYHWVLDRLFTISQWTEILNLTIGHGKKPMLLFNDRKAIDFGMTFNPELVEIHSVCLNDYNLLNHLKNCLDQQTGIVLGIGGSTLYEIENSINLLNHRKIILMHGFQNYPTNYADINLGKIKKIMQLYPEYKHGYADHTAWNHDNNILITLLGAALGMNLIEKHVTTLPGNERTDWQAAISIEKFNELCDKLQTLEECYGDGALELNEGEKAYSIFGPNKKAAILNRYVAAGEKLTAECYSFKRTGQKTDLSQIEVVNNHSRAFRHELPAGHCIQKSDLV